MEKMTDGISESLAGRNTTGAKVKVLGYITDPLTDSIIDVSFLLNMGLMDYGAPTQECMHVFWRTKRHRIPILI